MKELLIHIHKQKKPTQKCGSSIIDSSIWAKALKSQFTSIVDTRTGETIKPFGSYITRT